MRQPWTTVEIEQLRTAYLTGGIKAARTALPHRTERAIRCAARKAGIKLDNPYQFHFKKWQSDPLDNAIGQAFQRRADGDRQALQQVAQAYQVTVKYVRDRGAKLGVSQSREMRLWKPAEDDIIQDFLEFGIGKIQTELRRRGYHRTLWSVKRQKERLKLRAVGVEYWSAVDISGILGVSENTVRRWINAGLPAQRITLFGSPDATPHKWSIRPKDLKVWLRDNPHKWDLRKVQHHSIVLELLAGPPKISGL